MNFERPPLDNGAESEQAPVRPESVNDLPLIEVTDGEEGYEIARAVAEKPGETQGELEGRLREQLARENWWLQEYWRNKEIQEQIAIKLGDTEVSIYNFGAILDAEQVHSIEKALLSFANLSQGEVFKKIHSILIDDIQKTNPRTGQDMNGYAGRDKGIKLYPKVLEPAEHRVSGVSNLEGTVIHELSHNIDIDIINKWRKEMGWKDREVPEELPGGAYSYEYTEEPEKCVTEYARVSAEEDFCDSMVAALRSPEMLDPVRLAFIRKELLQEQEATVPEGSEIERRLGNQVIFPKLGAVRYKRKRPGTFRMQ